jgi:hypothetical protein
LQRSQDEAGKEPNDEAGEVDMEGFVFLFHELRLEAGTVCFHGWMVIVGIPAWDLRCRRCKIALKWNSFCAYVKGSGVVWD